MMPIWVFVLLFFSGVACILFMIFWYHNKRFSQLASRLNGSFKKTFFMHRAFFGIEGNRTYELKYFAGENFESVRITVPFDFGFRMKALKKGSGAILFGKLDLAGEKAYEGIFVQAGGGDEHAVKSYLRKEEVKEFLPLTLSENVTEVVISKDRIVAVYNVNGSDNAVDNEMNAGTLRTVVRQACSLAVK